MNLAEKNIIITGGTGGLGREMVSMLVRKKSKVIVFDINDKLLDSLSKKYNCVDPILCDVTDPLQVTNKVNDVYEKYGQLHGLINNAGLIYNEPLINLLSIDRVHSIDSWKKTIECNLTSVFLMTANVVDKMISKRTKGVIINISSISSNGNAGQSAYSAAKAGVNSLTATWAKELGVFGIRTVAISPGFIETESTRHAISERAVTELKTEIPLGKLGHARHIAKSVIHAFECNYINGKIIEIDGGLVL
jgi:3-oxoacyl-[acyl-carrier protein] reductase